MEDHETVRAEGRVSKAGLWAVWVSIPAALLLPLIFTYMPYLLKMLFSISFKKMIYEQYDVDFSSRIHVFKVITELIFENVPDILIILMCIPVALLIIVWLVLCIYKTSRYFRYHIVLTDLRIIGKAGNDELNAPLNEIKNVFIEWTWFGRIFNYGNIVVITKRKSLTFKNMSNPKQMYHIIMSHAQDYAAH